MSTLALPSRLIGSGPWLADPAAPLRGATVSPSRRNIADFQVMQAAARVVNVDVPDETLMTRLARGDRAALGVLYQRYAVDVKRVAMLLLREEAQADDVVQEIFLEAWRRAESFDATRGTARTWLVVRARSRCLDRLRKTGRRAEVQLEVEGQGVDTQLDNKVDTLHLPRAFSRLNDDERAVLLLGYFEGLTSAEIADRLALPQGTVKSRTRTAISKIREFWEKEKKR